MNPQPQPPAAPEWEDGVLKSLVKTHIHPETRGLEKQMQYLRMRRADFYYRGITNIVLNAGVDGSLDYRQFGGPTGWIRGDEPDMQAADYTVNLLRGYGRKYTAAMGTRPWHNSKVEPDDNANEADRRASRLAHNLVMWLKAKWNVRGLNYQIAYHHWKDGTVFIYSPFVADGEIFGWQDVPIYEESEQEIEAARYECFVCGAESPEPPPSPEGGVACPECGTPMSEENFRPAETAMVPMRVGSKRYPRSGPIAKVCTGYEVTLPWDCRDLNKAPWLMYEYEEHLGKLLEVYGDELRTKIENAETESDGDNYARLSRRALSSPNGAWRGTMENRATHRRIWLRASEFENVKEREKREFLKETYPDGLKISMVGDHIVRKENEALSDVWTAIRPEITDFVNADPYSYSILEAAELGDLLWSTAVAFAERKLPTLLADPSLGIAEYVNNRASLPMEVLEVAQGYNRRIDDGIGVVPTPNGEVEQYIGILSAVDQNIQMTSGLDPTIYGQIEKHATAEAARNALNQAVAMLAPNGENIAQGFAELFTKAIRMIERMSTEDFPISGKDVTGSQFHEIVDLEALQNGRWHIEAEVGVPMSWAERRSQLNEIITQNPELAKALNLDQPINVPVVRDYLLPGMNELRVPQEDMREKVLATIQELLQMEPISGPDGMPMPSIEPEVFVDTPEMAGIVHAWLVSAAGRREAAENIPGYQNVVLYGMALADLGGPPPGEVPQEGGMPPGDMALDGPSPNEFNEPPMEAIPLEQQGLAPEGRMNDQLLPEGVIA